VLLRFLFNAPVEWADDVARGLMVGSSFFGAASALARSENLWRGVFHRHAAGAGPPRRRFRRRAAGDGDLGLVAYNAIKLGWLTTGQHPAPACRWN